MRRQKSILDIKMNVFKNRVGLVIWILAALVCVSGPVFSEKISTRVIVNGTPWLDTQGNEIWCNGGQTLQKGDTWYWVGYDTGPGREWSIKLYSSKNLVDWKFLRILLAKGPGVPEFKWAGRPGLLYNRKTRRYIILFESETGQWFRHKVGYASCDRIDGDYKYEHSEFPEPDRSTGDQSIYQEGDDAYLLTVLDSPGLKDPINKDLAIYQLSPDFLHVEKKLFEGFDRFEPGARGNEATHIVKVGGIYYWFMSGLNSWNSTETQYSTARQLKGPWSPLKVLATEPLSGNSFNSQHDFIITVKGKDKTSYIYAGDRYSQWTMSGTGRNIFLPLEFEKGVPKITWHDAWTIDMRTGRYSEIRKP